MSWEDIERIHSITQLPALRSRPRFEVSGMPDGVPFMPDREIELGQLASPFRLIPLHIINPGREAITITDPENTDTFAAILRDPNSGPQSLPPGSVMKLSVFVRAAGLPPGDYFTRSSLSYASNSAEGSLVAAISFAVPESKVFTMDVYPRSVDARTMRKGTVTMECCNYSDVQGEVFVAHYGLNQPGKDRRYVLKPRESLFHKFGVSEDERIPKNTMPRIVFRNVENAMGVSVPIAFRMPPT